MIPPVGTDTVFFMFSVTEGNTAKCVTRAQWFPPGVGGEMVSVLF